MRAFLILGLVLVGCGVPVEELRTEAPYTPCLESQAGEMRCAADGTLFTCEPSSATCDIDGGNCMDVHEPLWLPLVRKDYALPDGGTARYCP